VYEAKRRVLKVYRGLEAKLPSFIFSVLAGNVVSCRFRPLNLKIFGKKLFRAKAVSNLVIMESALAIPGKKAGVVLSRTGYFMLLLLFSE
jgi:hypothetical protein